MWELLELFDWPKKVKLEKNKIKYGNGKKNRKMNQNINDNGSVMKAIQYAHWNHSNANS